MELIITYSKVKHGYARIGLDGILKLTIPNRLKNDEELKNMMIEKGKKLFDKHKYRNLNKIQCFDGNKVLVFGEKIEIEVIDGNIDEYLKNKLLEFSLPIISNLSRTFGINYQSITIKNIKSKRGSCSHDNKIILNQKLVHLPMKYLNYVCIHEACHMKQKNHSKRFRNLVETFLPDYKELRKGLRSVSI